MPNKPLVGGSEDRRTGVRVNLTLPPEVDYALQRVAVAAGTGKSSFVRELLSNMVPQLHAIADGIEAAKQGQSDGLAMLAKGLRASIQQGEQAELELGKVRAMARKRHK